MGWKNIDIISLIIDSSYMSWKNDMGILNFNIDTVKTVL